MKNFIAKLRSFFSGQPAATPAEAAAISDELVRTLMHNLTRNQGDSYDCQQVFQTLDEYVDRDIAQADAARLMPLVKQHLDLCPDCHEHYELLLDILSDTAPAG